MSNAVLSVPGDAITYRAGRATITLQYVRAGAYTVTVYQGTLRVEDNCGSYPTEGEARLIARGYAHMYKAEADTTPVTLADLAKQGTHRQVRPTMAGAHLAPLSGPQQRALDSHTDGVVFVGDGITAATLRSLDRKGYGKVAFEGRRKRVVSLVLNGRGLAAVSKAVA
ncbi:hypothetical protein GCM10011608_10700 [Micromonospora sonchi]|uniref:Uncharacterized protein n=1 Tax=Micromonospora sonchi TaxID=1763543 RepID=A0A917TM84_9ACTN|nr:hypothetical protein [Micromonospora sonchi]GGM27745.1 hypothetical protein GCM10011608_10700 [Micromonospora sonchi]